jgi:hypothetical protein
MEEELTTARNLFGDAADLIEIQEEPEDPKAPPLYEQIAAYFKAHKFESFTTIQLAAAFPARKFETVRNAVRRLVRARDVKCTGAINWKRWKHNDDPTDHAYITLTLYR